MTKILPKYPIYIPSKGRSDRCKMAGIFAKDGVPFKIVVEPQEHDDYARHYGEKNILVLPFSNLNLGSIPARNWIKQHSIEQGAERHWQFDDNIRAVYYFYKGRRMYCDSAIALANVEEFTDRYTNIAISGLNYATFVVDHSKHPPFSLNHKVYSATLFNNALPHVWRGRYNEDTDMCLQVLADGWCTVLVNTFLVEKLQTMRVKGGNTQELYQGDGRLKMARSLERVWPGVVSVDRRFNRPQHKVKDEWARFDTPLQLKPGLDLSALSNRMPRLKLIQVGETVKSPALKKIVEQYNTSDD